MIIFTIDGQTVQAEEGETILEVAHREGVSIPTLCYHPAVKPYGACRMCIVEVEQRGWTKLETSCTIPVREGMIVRTNTPDVYKVRQTLMGVFLSRCPNVPIIQDLAREYGITEPPLPTDDPDEKCILCGLCVRVCHELVKADVLDFSQRGIERQVGPPFLETTHQCIGCGACTIVCPTGAIELVMEKAAVYKEMPLGPTSAIYVPSLQAMPRIPVIDTDVCIHFRQNDRTNGKIADACGVCQMVCEADAINFDQQDEIIELDVGNIIVATGYDPFDARRISQYGYGRYPNVFTSPEIERMLTGSGPTNGHVVLRDGETEPESIGIIHCVGSRDENYNPYCSKVCCMYSLKLAHLVQDHTGARIYEFYIDMRTGGKAYEEFYKRLQKEGTIFINGRPSEILPEDGKLAVYVEDRALGRQMRVPVDMVILSVGLEPRHDAREVAQLFSISCDADGWFKEKHPKLDPVATLTDGVFIAGCAQGPRDIPESVAQGAAAAARVLSLICQGEVEAEAAIAVVDEMMCVGCGQCVQTCPYSAIEFLEDRKVARVVEALCKGCGTCAGTCPSKAVTLRHFTDRQLIAEMLGAMNVMWALETVTA